MDNAVRFGACRIAMAASRIAMLELVLGLLVGSLGCRPRDVLIVDPPAGVQANTPFGSKEGAESAFNGAKALVFSGLAGSAQLFRWAGLLSDEFTWTGNSIDPRPASVDARITSGHNGYFEVIDNTLASLLRYRSQLLIAAVALEKYESTDGEPKVGEAYALVGYTELYLAEDYCAGVPLSRVIPEGGFEYGTAVTTDSLLALAEAHFDSALAHSVGNSDVENLAHVGLARTQLDRAKYLEAAEAAKDVPAEFAYYVETKPSVTAAALGSVNLYAAQFAQNRGCGFMNVSDREGGNGLNFVSANDPRLVIDSTIAKTCDGRSLPAGRGNWYYPTKFGNPSSFIAIATGVEARLIEAEAALKTGQINTWATDLNALRGSAQSTYLHLGAPMPPLTVDSTTLAGTNEQVNVLFRERAFWLFGTGTRLGDMRRLVRQYNRAAESVFPTGPYANGNDPRLPAPLPSYGSDVSLTLPTAASGFTTTNPNYKGCLTSPGTA